MRIDGITCWPSTLIHVVGECLRSKRFTRRDSGLKRASIDSLSTIRRSTTSFARGRPGSTAVLAKCWCSVVLVAVLRHGIIFDGRW